MKRYKIISWEHKKGEGGYEAALILNEFIKYGTEIVLEEVEEIKEKAFIQQNPLVERLAEPLKGDCDCDCITEPCMHSEEVAKFAPVEETLVVKEHGKSLEGWSADRMIEGIKKIVRMCDEIKESQPKEECAYCIKFPNLRCTCDCHKDQPLTPKDVGIRKGRAWLGFYNWFLNYGYKELPGRVMFSKLEDEDFDRLFQEFLKQYKK